MKNTALLLIPLFIFLSCRKTADPVDLSVVVPVPAAIPYRWCDDHIACWGDSHTAGLNATGYPLQLGVQYYNDVILTTSNGPYLKNGSVFFAGFSGEPSNKIRERFMLDTIHRKWANIIWVGANNAWDTTQIASDINVMVKSLNHEKFLLLETLGGDVEDRWKGGGYYRNLEAFNNSLSKKYDKHFIYVVSYLQQFADKSYEDSMSLVHGQIPSSLRLDDLHCNTTGYKHLTDLIVSRLVTCN